MLRELRIGNLALVEEAVIPFGPGLTMLTGETGAGKSLIAGSLSLLAGGKPSSDLIRKGEELAYVEGLFDLSGRPEAAAAVRNLGLRLGDDGILVLRRELRREGRSRVLINGLLSSLALLEQIGPLVVNIQSQDQQRILSRPNFACDYLDRRIGAEGLRQTMAAARARFLELRDELDRRRSEEALAREQCDLWEFQLRELQQAGLDAEEEARLAEQIHFGRNARKLLEGAAAASRLLDDEDPSARGQLGRAIGALRPIAGDSGRLVAVVELLENAQSALAEAVGILGNFLDAVEVDPSQLDEMEDRKALYEDLRRKYRRDLAGLLELQDRLAERVARQGNAAEDLAGLEDRLEEGRRAMAEAALALRQARRSGAGAVEAAAREVIRPLALAGLDLEFSVTPATDPGGALALDGALCRVTDRGADEVRLLVRTNPGENWGQAHQIASGGERSRIFLGLSVLDRDPQEAVLRVFDEIDAGLGLEGAVPVADLLERLAEGGQVVCITHLPTVAGRGSDHLKVGKAVRGGRTVLTVRPLDPDGRLEEIARLLGGDGGGDRQSQLAYAGQLLGPGRRRSGAA